MRLRRIGLVFASALTLASCGLASPLNLLPPAPVEAADQTTLDERLGLGAETVYQAAAQAVVFKHKVAPFSEEDLKRVKQLDAQAVVALALVRQAYKAANAENYQKAYDDVVRICAEIVKAVGS